MQVTAIYPGTFDPITNGHLDIIERGVRLFDRVIVALLRNADKEPFLPLEERQAIVRAVVARFPGVTVESFDGLLVDYCRARGARAIVRGLRALSDFEYELQMALMNRRLEPGVETVFMMPSEAWSYVSSRLVKEVARLGGDVSGLVPKEALPALQALAAAARAERGR
jgi:pantetheine-phosphate adenylyltransferase